MNDAAERLLTICRTLVDPDAQPIELHEGHGGTIALRAQTCAGAVIVKVHRAPKRHQQELHAYMNWTTALGEQAPRLLGASDDPPAIVVSALPGQSLAETPLPPHLEAKAHQQAGAILRTFHQAEPPADQPNMTDWLSQRAEYWLARARDIWPGSRHADIRAHMRELRALGPIASVPCHLDFMPRNLLCWRESTAEPYVHNQEAKTRDQIRVAVIDFEHSRWDLAARDLVRLATRLWPQRPDLEEAFVSEYGALSDVDREVIAHCAPLDTLTAAVRAAERPSAPALLSTADRLAED